MNMVMLEEKFSSYLDEFRELDNSARPFALVYIGLLFLFESEISLPALHILLERKKQLLGGGFGDAGFIEFKDASRKGVEKGLGDGFSEARKMQLNRLYFCAMLDAKEGDFFYFTEPIFEFSREMMISPDQLHKILESEFVGFKV
jgi:hypothetical protein